MFAAGAASPPKMPPAEPEATGHLAYIGANGNVYVTDANRTSTVAITHNATAPLLFTICS